MIKAVVIASGRKSATAIVRQADGDVEVQIEPGTQTGLELVAGTDHLVWAQRQKTPHVPGSGSVILLDFRTTATGSVAIRWQFASVAANLREKHEVARATAKLKRIMAAGGPNFARPRQRRAQPAVATV